MKMYVISEYSECGVLGVIHERSAGQQIKMIEHHSPCGADLLDGLRTATSHINDPAGWIYSLEFEYTDYNTSIYQSSIYRDMCYHLNGSTR